MVCKGFYIPDCREFFVLHACDGGLKSERLVSYMYLYQAAYRDIGFRYRLGTGVACPALNELVGSMIVDGLIERDGDSLRRTELGNVKYCSNVLTYEERCRLDYLQMAFDGMTDGELHFVCIADGMVSDLRGRHGSAGLITGRKNVEDVLRRLTREYSDENLSAAMRLIMDLRGE